MGITDVYICERYSLNYIKFSMLPGLGHYSLSNSLYSVVLRNVYNVNRSYRCIQTVASHAVRF